MRGRGTALAVFLAVAAMPAAAKRPAPASFAEPGDIIAAEGSFTRLSAAKGEKAAIRATAAPDAEIFAPQPMRVVDYANRIADPNLAAQWHTAQVWMSCDGSYAVTHGQWQHPPAIGWYVAVWHRQKGGGYKWVLAEKGALPAPPPESDMISASVADCPARHTRSAPGRTGIPTPNSGKAPVADYSSGHADDATLDWTTTLAGDGGRTFTLRVSQDGVLHEVLRAIAAPPGA